MTFISGPHQTGRKRFEPFKLRGFKGPYLKWADMDRDIFHETTDKFDIPRTEETYFLIDKSVHYLVDFLNKNKKFDGFCCFS